MNRSTGLILTLIFSLFLLPGANAQVVLTSKSRSALIDFENTVSGAAEGVFDGSGFSPLPSAGGLDSDAWSVTGFSDGDLAFGGTVLSGDLARGTTFGGTGTGGLYALADFPDSGGRALHFQPGGTDVTPGSVTLKIVNLDKLFVIRQIAVSYDIYEYNDQGRSTYLNFSYSLDGSLFIPLSKLDHVTGEAPSPFPVFERIGGSGPSRTAAVANLNVAPGGGLLFLRWDTDDSSGTGSRDELAIDNISITADFAAPTSSSGRITGTVIDSSANGVPFVRISLSGPGVGSGAFAVTNQFGNFEFIDLPIGGTYLLQASSGRLAFKTPEITVMLGDEITRVRFEGITDGMLPGLR